MMRQKKISKILSVLFLSIYTFAFIFASNIHHHNGGYYYKNFNFKNAQSSLSAKISLNNSDDCLSCHFAAAAYTLPSKIELQEKPLLGGLNVISFYSFKELLSYTQLPSPRGPPSIFA